MIARLKRYSQSRPLLHDLLKYCYRQFRSTEMSRRLASFSRQYSHRVRFVQIGASDGLRNDPLREWIVSHPWSGIFVEPLPFAFTLLQRNYAWLKPLRQLHFVNAAVSDHDGSLSLWSYSESFLRNHPLEQQLHYLRKSSANRAHVAQWLPPGATDDALVRIDVAALSPTTLFERYCDATAPDLLAIDAEGHEARILQAIDFARWPIGAVYFETLNLTPQQRTRVYDQLQLAGYSIEELGIDAFAQRG